MEDKIILLEDLVKAPCGVRTTNDNWCKRIYSDNEYYVYITPIKTYEVFYRTTKPLLEVDKESGLPRKVDGVMKEAYPRDNDFGSWAWSYSRLESVIEFLFLSGRNVKIEDLSENIERYYKN